MPKKTITKEEFNELSKVMDPLEINNLYDIESDEIQNQIQYNQPNSKLYKLKSLLILMLIISITVGFYLKNEYDKKEAWQEWYFNTLTKIESAKKTKDLDEVLYDAMNDSLLMNLYKQKYDAIEKNYLREREERIQKVKAEEKAEEEKKKKEELNNPQPYPGYETLMNDTRVEYGGQTKAYKMEIIIVKTKLMDYDDRFPGFVTGILVGYTPGNPEEMFYFLYTGPDMAIKPLEKFFVLAHHVGVEYLTIGGVSRRIPKLNLKQFI